MDTTLQGAGRQNWISDNFGQLWHVVDSPGQTLGLWTQIKMHPTQVKQAPSAIKLHCHLHMPILQLICWKSSNDILALQNGSC